jgi:hypothetical protein
MAAYLVLYTFILLHVGFFMQIVSQLVSAGLQKGLPELYADFLRQQLCLVVSLVAVAPCIVLDMLKFSNRIAGPLYRCRRVMQDMTDGKPVREFVPRQHDLLSDFWATLNGLIRAWNTRVSTTDGSVQPTDTKPQRTVKA